MTVIVNLLSRLEFLKVNRRFDVILGSIGAQIIGIINTFFLTWALLPIEYGKFSFGVSVFNIFAPFIGFGLNYSLLQYTKNNDEIDDLSSYSLFWGTILSGITAVFYILTVRFLSVDSQVRWISFILSFQFISIFPLRILQSRLRILKKNEVFAKTTWTNSLILFICVIFAYRIGGIKGIVVAYSVYPIITLLLFKRYLLFLWSNFNINIKSVFNKLDYFKYGIYTSLGSIASQLLYSMDILMINTISQDPILVAIYKVGSLVSVNGLLFCTSIMSADFIAIKEMKNDVLKRYYLKLTKKMLLFSLVFTIVSIPIVYFVTHSILDPVYQNSFTIHLLLMIGFIFSFAVRIPIGNIMYARGYANYNAVNAYSSLIVNLVLNVMLIKKYSIYGAAIATIITMIFGSIFANYIFYKYIVSRRD